MGLVLPATPAYGIQFIFTGTANRPGLPLGDADAENLVPESHTLYQQCCLRFNALPLLNLYDCTPLLGNHEQRVSVSGLFINLAHI